MQSSACLKGLRELASQHVWHSNSSRQGSAVSASPGAGGGTQAQRRKDHDRGGSRRVRRKQTPRNFLITVNTARGQFDQKHYGATRVVTPGEFLNLSVVQPLLEKT
jgi:hypothetical protein